MHNVMHFYVECMLIYLTKNRIIEFENLKKTYYLLYKYFIFMIYMMHMYTHTHIHEK